MDAMLRKTRTHHESVIQKVRVIPLRRANIPKKSHRQHSRKDLVAALVSDFIPGFHFWLGVDIVILVGWSCNFESD